MTDEPHHQEPSTDETPDDTPDKTPEATGASRDPESEEQQDLNLGAVSGFFSGFAAAVQTTVSSGGRFPVLLLTMVSLSCAEPRIGYRRTGRSGESGQEDDGGSV